MSIAQQINVIVEQLPPTEQTLIFELVRRINSGDILTPEDEADVIEARAEYERGATISGDAINWD